MQDHDLITDVKTLAERIVWARERKGLTQEALANRAGVSQGTIGNLESGARKSPRSLLAIAAVLGVEPRWLESGKEPIETDETSFTSQVIQDFGAKIVHPIDRDALSSVLLSLGALLAQLDERSRKMVGVLLSDLAQSPEDATDIARRAADVAGTDAARLQAQRVKITPGEGYQYKKLNPEQGIDLPSDPAQVDKKSSNRE